MEASIDTSSQFAALQWYDVAGDSDADASGTSQVFLGPSPRGGPAGETPLAPGPQAFKVVLAPAAPVGVHFHPVAQYQLFLGANCKFSGHEVGRGVVHYADPYTPYGPISPQESPTTFVTLRSRADRGAYYMPDARAILASSLSRVPPRSGSRRSISFDLLDDEACRPKGEWTTLVDHSDGLRIAMFGGRPGELIPSLLVGGTGGYLVVLEGDVRNGPVVHGSDFEAWCPPGTEVAGCAAGNVGARLAMLQLPVDPS